MSPSLGPPSASSNSGTCVSYPSFQVLDSPGQCGVLFFKDSVPAQDSCALGTWWFKLLTFPEDSLPWPPTPSPAPGQSGLVLTYVPAEFH